MISGERLPVWAFDIETIPSPECEKWVDKQTFTPNTQLSEATIENVPATIKNLKNAELRESRTKEWLKEQQTKIDENLVVQRQKKLLEGGLKWWTGQIICIVAMDCNSTATYEFYNSNEAALLMDFRHALNGCETLIGKSSEGFDKPFLIGKLMKYKYTIPGCVKFAQDIDKYFGGKWGMAGKLDDYAFGLGIDGKTGHGSLVFDWYKAGRKDDIIKYCKQDVALVKEIYRRYNAV
jgi:hypothetical protein